MTVEVSDEEFADLVDRAIAGIPADLLADVDNVTVVIEGDSPPDEPTLLGLYEGVPITERGEFYGGALPDKITIFRHPIVATCHSLDEVVEQVRITVVHEIAHYFGIDDHRLDELGYG